LLKLKILNKKNKILFINEFAKLAGVYPDTVRNYQEKGLLMLFKTEKVGDDLKKNKY
jgi:hypothetical protein